MTISRARGCCRAILLTALVTMLSSCDGGIFGTGDGTDVVSADNIDAVSVDSQSPESPDSPTDSLEQPASGTQPEDSNAQTLEEIRSFENLQIGSNSARPMIALVNLSTVPLNVTTSAIDLFPEAILPGVVSDYASLDLASTELSVISDASAESLLTLSPLNLGAYSVSTLIARDRLSIGGTQSDTLSEVEIIAIASQQLPSEDSVARVRLLQASPLDANDLAASMSLVPADETPGGSEIELGSLSASSFGTSSEYRLATPGSYDLVDSQGRFEPIPFELLDGEFHTLILTGSPLELLVLRDSQ